MRKKVDFLSFFSQILEKRPKFAKKDHFLLLSLRDLSLNWWTEYLLLVGTDCMALMRSFHDNLPIDSSIKFVQHSFPFFRPTTPFRLKTEQAPNRSLGAEEELERSLTGAEQESLIITIVFGYSMAILTKKSLNFVFFRWKIKKKPDSTGKVNQNGLKVKNTS